MAKYVLNQYECFDGMEWSKQESFDNKFEAIERMLELNEAFKTTDVNEKFIKCTTQTEMSICHKLQNHNVVEWSIKEI